MADTKKKDDDAPVDVPDRTSASHGDVDYENAGLPPDPTSPQVVRSPDPGIPGQAVTDPEKVQEVGYFGVKPTAADQIDPAIKAALASGR